MKKHICLLIVAACLMLSIKYAPAADIKVSSMTAANSVTSDDLLMVVNDPGGTPASRKITVNDFLTSGGTLASGDIFYWGATGLLSLPKGTAGQMLLMNGAGNAPVWDSVLLEGAEAELPATCSVKQRFLATDTQTEYLCTALNTWSIVISGGSADGSHVIRVQNNTSRTPTTAADELYPEGDIWKANQNGTESSICIAPSAGQVVFTGSTAPRTITMPDAATTIGYDDIVSFAWDNGASAISTSAGKRCRRIKRAATIDGYSLLMDASSTTTIKLYKDAFSDSTLPTTDITGGHFIATAAKLGKTDDTLTDWTVAITAGDVICAEVTVNDNAKWATLILHGRR